MGVLMTVPCARCAAVFVVVFACTTALAQGDAGTRLSEGRAARQTVNGCLRGCTTVLLVPATPNEVVEAVGGQGAVSAGPLIRNASFSCMTGRFRSEQTTRFFSGPAPLQREFAYSTGDGVCHHVSDISFGSGGAAARTTESLATSPGRDVEDLLDIPGALGFGGDPQTAAIVSRVTLPNGAELAEGIDVNGRECTELRYGARGGAVYVGEWYASGCGYALVRREQLCTANGAQWLDVTQVPQLADIPGLGWVPVEKQVLHYLRDAETDPWRFASGLAIWASGLEVLPEAPSIFDPWYPNPTFFFSNIGGTAPERVYGIDTRSLEEAVRRGEYPFDTEGQPRVMLLEEETE